MWRVGFEAEAGLLSSGLFKQEATFQEMYYLCFVALCPSTEFYC